MTDKPLIQANGQGSITEIAQILGLSCRRIQQLCSMGILPKPLKKGKYDLTVCTRRYSEHQRRKLRALNQKRGYRLKKKVDTNVSSLSTEQISKIIKREIADLLTGIKRIKEEKKKPGINLKLDLSEYQ